VCEEETALCGSEEGDPWDGRDHTVVSGGYLWLFFLLTLLVKMEQSVPKCQHIKFRHWGITQKTEYNK